MQRRDGSIEKSIRLIVLMKLQDAGLLAGLSLQKIANMFPDAPNRSTILRDLKDVERLRKTLRQFRTIAGHR